MRLKELSFKPLSYLYSEVNRVLKMGIDSYRKVVIQLFFSMALMLANIDIFAQTQSTVCAVVKIEIAQELTIERQAFEATLDIENTLADKTITDIRVVVDFQDENGNSVVATSDPNDTSAKFFIRVNSLEGINDVSGVGTLDGGETAKATWLIIPAPGASEGIPSGKLYFVGASFQYKLDGIADSIEVAPDTIYVKPLPLLSLDYFLPRDVFADNPLTTPVEAPEPFTLGVRVQNNGQGVGKSIKIESAQPKIVENEQGLLIDFLLLNSFVQNESVNNSLLIDFGDIPSGESKVGRWNMQTSLSGRFTEFSAEYSHADELGGQLTSLLESVNTHTLVRDVLVDLQGRDDVKDFLAYDVFDPLSDSLIGLKVYESNSTTTNVDNQSTTATMTPAGGDYQVSLSPNPGFVYAQFDDPFSGAKTVSRVVRSDGKLLSPNNYWFSKSYNKTTKEISYHFNIFDVATTGQYDMQVTDPVVIPRHPIIQFISLKNTFEGNSLGFIVQASDPDGTLPAMTLLNPPQGVLFTDQGNGTAQLSWTPTVGQAGRYEFEVQASDGVLTAKRNIVIVVNSALDTDGDGLLDAWELAQFGNLDKDGTADTDGDGVSDLDEFDRGTDPNVTDGPLTPQILEPALQGFVATKTPELVVKNSEYIGSFDVVYAYEVYKDENFTELVSAYYAQPEDDSGETAWRTALLEEDTTYYWRVRAFDSFMYSPWVDGSFIVNSENALPVAPTLNSPALDQEIFINQLSLMVNAATDPDGDELFYKVSLYEDQAATILVSESGVLTQNSGNSTIAWQVPSSLSLTEGQSYYWQAEVVDVAGQPVKTDVFRFVLALSNTQTVPAAPMIQTPELGSRVDTVTPIFTVIDAVNHGASDALSYLFEVDTSATFESATTISSGWLTDNGTQPTFSWQVNQSLLEDTMYYWRVKARTPENIESTWSVSNVIVNAENQVPTVPVIKNPGDNSQVITRTPKLEVFPAEDGDQDTVHYVFEVYSDEQQTQLLVSQESSTPELLLDTLDDDKWYFWRARAIDEVGEASDWTVLNRFFVNEDNIDNEPEFTWLIPDEGVQVVEGQGLHLHWQDADPDSSALISLYYADNPEGANRQLIAQGIAEDEDGEGDRIKWSSRGLAAGNYYFFAIIEDASNVVPVIAEPTFVVTVGQFDLVPLQVVSVVAEGSNANHMIDNNYGTFWSHSTDQEIDLTFDFGVIKRFNQMRVAFGNTRQIRYEYSVEASIDGSQWIRVADHDLSTKVDNWTYATQFAALNARYVRLILHTAYTDSGNQAVSNKSIFEVQLRGGTPFAD